MSGDGAVRFDERDRGVEASDTQAADAEPFTASLTTNGVPVLYWSRLGEVACNTHAPAPLSLRWTVERWAQMPLHARRRHGVEYQCQHCAESRLPIARGKMRGRMTERR